MKNDRLLYLFYGINFISEILTKGPSKLGRNSMDVSCLGLSLSDQSWDYPSLQGFEFGKISDDSGSGEVNRPRLRIRVKCPTNSDSSSGENGPAPWWFRVWFGFKSCGRKNFDWLHGGSDSGLESIHAGGDILLGSIWRRPLIMRIILAPAPALIAYPDDFRARLREKSLASTLDIYLSVTKWALKRRNDFFTNRWALSGLERASSRKGGSF